jgi:hypothetical protein
MKTLIPKMVQKLALRLRESSRGSTIAKGGSIKECNTPPLCDRSNPGALTQPESQFLNHFRYKSQVPFSFGAPAMIWQVLFFYLPF